ncbi:hypothetical protein CFIO01_02169, partial [Colletotrichum fioriniae PJ7]
APATATFSEPKLLGLSRHLTNCVIYRFDLTTVTTGVATEDAGPPVAAMKTRKCCWTCTEPGLPYNAIVSKAPEAAPSWSWFYGHRPIPSLSLVTFGQNTWKIRNALMSMALIQDTNSGLALLNALLAYASLHRHGLNEQAVRLKIQAIHYLSASVTSETLILGKAAQHVAASMVLGAFEIMQPSEGSGEWLWHTWGAVDMIHATQLKDEPHDSDVGQLLNWAYYHETQSRFALHHWRHKSLVPKTSNNQDSTLQNLQYPPLTRYRPVCDTLVDPRDPRSQDKSYQNQLKDLGGRVRDISVKTAIPSASDPDAAFAIELYQMATQIYLVRASQSPWEPPANIDALVEAAFEGPVQSCTCEHFFPLLILACEAQRDEQRIGIINLIERTQRDVRIRSIQAVKNTIQSIWVQQDLHKDDDVLVDYLGTLSSAISSSNTVPSFA